MKSAVRWSDCYTKDFLMIAPNVKRSAIVPYGFRRMIGESGPVGACRRVIVSPKLPEGFGRLAELEALHLTAEAAVVRGPWRTLFDQDIIEAANKRLRKFNRPDLY